MDLGKIQLALDHYEKEADFFDRNYVRYESELLAVKMQAELNLQYELERTQQLVSKLPGSTAFEFWDESKVLLERIKNFKDEYQSYRILRRNPSKDYNQLLEYGQKLEAQYVQDAQKNFLEFDHFWYGSFFASYPVSIPDRNAFWNAHFSSLSGKLRKATQSDLLRFTQAYGDAGENVLTDGQESLLSLLLLSKTTGIERVGSPQTKVEVYFLTKPNSLLSVHSDLSFRIFRVSEPPKKNEPGTYSLLVASYSQKRKHQTVNNQAMRSQFLVRYDRIYNPDYESARMDVFSAENQYNNVQADIRMGRYGGIIGAIAVNKAAGYLRDARMRLESTPMYLDQPVYQPYEFSVVNLTAQKEATGLMMLVDPAGKPVAKCVFSGRSSKSFTLGIDIHPNDKTNAGRYDSESRIEEFDLAPISVQLSDALASAECHKPGRTLQQLMAELSSVSPQIASVAEDKPAEDGRFHSVVAFLDRTGNAIGSGFFVGKGRILTNYHVVRGHRTVSMRSFTGDEFIGEVVRFDANADIALVEAEYQGRAVSFSRHAKQGSTVEAIGHPRGLEFSISRGIISATRESELRHRRLKHIQTDTPISPGNSGGPLFSGESVIGMNTFKLVGPASEGLGFAVHADTLLEFLEE